MREIAPRTDPLDGADLARQRPHVLLGERREQLAQQQRVAAGGLDAGGRERGVRLRAEAIRDQQRHARLAQWPRHDAQRIGARRELGHEHRVDAGLAAAQAQREHDPRAGEPAADVCEVPQRRRVAPVEIVDDKQQPPVLGEVDGQPVETVERRERAVARSRARRRHGLEDGRGRRGCAGQQPLARAVHRPARARTAGARRRRRSRARGAPRGPPASERRAGPARPVSSSSSRLLPIPAGPSTSTGPGRPRFWFRASTSAASSRSRSSSGVSPFAEPSLVMALADRNRTCAAPWTLALLRAGEIAQLVEHTTENRGVPGSSPGLAIRRTAC